MDPKRLEKIGLTKGESKVYIALLKLGVSTIGKIIKEANVSSSKIYDILDRLNKKGLVGAAIANNRKQFEAKDPSRIKEFIELKEKEIEDEKNEVKKLVPELQQIYKYAEPTQEAEILQGIKGIKTFDEMILSKLEKGDTFYILGIPTEANEVLWGYFQDWHERRAKKKVRCKMLYNADSKRFAEMRRKTPFTEVRYLPENIHTPALIDIGREYVATLLFGERPLCVVIKNKKIAESYIHYFELLWNISK
jgi:sugar-specific transcriptional regulator TrmB